METTSLHQDHQKPKRLDCHHGRVTRKIILIPKGAQPQDDTQALFLSLILHRTQSKQDYIDGEYLQLHSEILAGRLGKGYCNAIQALIKTGQVEPRAGFKTIERQILIGKAFA